MTTPMPPSGGGGMLGNLLGGITGSLAGANPLQSSVDQLTNAVNRLTTTMSTLNLSSAGRNQYNAGTQTTTAFPSVNVPGVNRIAGIGGGGPGGAGNVRAPVPFGRMGVGMIGAGMLAGSFASYGQGQMPFQLGLNAMASMSMMGTGFNMGQYSGFASMIGNQVVNPISSGPMDALQLAQQLQFMAGTPRIMGSALGRAGFGAAAAFGMTNPTLSGAASGSLAQQIYNPMLSMRMRLLGYSMTPRIMGSGMPQSIGNVAASLLQGWYGTNKVLPSQLMRTLSFGGRGFANLQYLGLNPQQMAPLLEGFNRLFNAGYTPEAASNLFTRAASSNQTVASKAQATLRNAGVTSVTSDIQKLRNNQSQVTQRSVNTAAGFNAALTASTDALQAFNKALNSILNATGMNGPLGALGGGFGTLAGTSHGNLLNGLGGLGLIGLASRMGAGSALGGAGGALGGGMLARLGLGGLGAGGLAVGAAGAGAALFGLSRIHNPNGTNWLQQGPGGPGSGWNSWGALGHNISNWWNDIFSGGPGGNWSGAGSRFNMPNIGGGAAVGGGGNASTTQQGSRSQTTSGISASAFKAVTAAESQLGIPYQWGGETPGVGFDCSGLVQWAYKQAGVNLPRTSQQQYASLRKKMVPLSQAQEGDIVFAAGSDGTTTAPGHEGLMINRSQLIQAPYTGANVQIIGYNPRDWVGAARPSGRGNFSISNNVPGQNVGASALGLYGNTGMGLGLGNYGSVNEVDLISATGGFMGASGAFSAGGLGGVMSSMTGSTNGSSTSGSPMGNGSKQIRAEQAYAMALLRARGWGNQYASLNNIFMRESGWRWDATNPGSGAYGIPQALPGSKMAAAGKDWKTNPDTQLRWAIDMYIPQRYGNPNKAWQFWQQNGWYGAGGWNLPPGFKMVGERGPELMFTGGGNSILSNAQSMALMKAVAKQPQQSPWQAVSNQMKYGGDVVTPGRISSPSAGGGISMIFHPNSICVKVSTGNTTSGNLLATDAQSIGKASAKAFVQHLESELLLSTIAQGVKN